MSQPQLQVPVLSLKARRNANENFRKRVKTLSSKCSELWRDYEADTYFIVHRNGRFYIYTSTDEPSWPLGPEKLQNIPSTSEKVTSTFRRVKPVDAHEKPKKSWGFCVDCMRYRPTRKSYWNGTDTCGNWVAWDRAVGMQNFLYNAPSVGERSGRVFVLASMPRSAGVSA
ncbi:hypothetical protein P154DRAFT_600463 [Amniculicola lignicola CBS 123094]|uniref:MADS-box domain-containing protein n=1 Tax=Amniculicola lignicola CBS 123094 TaxID=1392246 RepID=A0A6A5WY63_9PLEO|nr:hypothetical protein P154DRAFT_600463 [Amniculicola lignicola CBS 123094]